MTNFSIYLSISIIIVLLLGSYYFVLVHKLIKRIYFLCHFKRVHDRELDDIFCYKIKKRISPAPIRLLVYVKIFTWMLKVPSWAEKDKKSSLVLKKIKHLAIIFNLSIVLLLIGMAETVGVK